MNKLYLLAILSLCQTKAKGAHETKGPNPDGVTQAELQYLLDRDEMDRDLERIAIARTSDRAKEFLNLLINPSVGPEELEPYKDLVNIIIYTRSPLHISVATAKSEQDYAKMQWLIDNGANVEALTVWSHKTQPYPPLCWAPSNDRIIRMIAEAKCSPIRKAWMLATEKALRNRSEEIKKIHSLQKANARKLELNMARLQEARLQPDEEIRVNILKSIVTDLTETVQKQQDLAEKYIARENLDLASLRHLSPQTQADLIIAELQELNQSIKEAISHL